MYFILHEHLARRHHYDLRLELGGVLKSWAIPKGPSLDPAEKRLAVQVEDHALAYGEFEGSIPEGAYGAGEVVIWDRGEWLPETGDPEGDLTRGKLSFTLRGGKLAGGFALVRMRGRGENDWLLIKQRDDEARTGWQIQDRLSATRRTRSRR